MGDFWSPKRRDVVDRLRRRIEVYRQHQNGCIARYEPSINGRYDQCRQETQLLQRRWLDSKEKKAAKQPKTNKETNSLSEQRNLVVSQKLKRKLDSHQAAENNPNIDCGPFTFNDDPVEPPPLKKRAGGVDLSVQIVQQINNSQPDHSQTIETNVTVTSALKPLHGNGNTNSPHLQTGGQSSTSIRTSTSVECKQEPSEENPCVEPQGGHPGFNSDFDDDLQALLETLEKEGGLSEDILNDLVKLDKLDDVCYKVSRDTKDSGPNDSMNVLSPAPPKGNSPAVQAGQSTSSTSMSQMYDVNQNMDSLQAAVPPISQFRPNSQSQMSSLAETGPAAETLKQMAAHHQNQNPPPAYVSIKSSPMSPFSEPLQEERFMQHRNGYPPNYQQQGYSGMSQQNGQTASMYPYNQQVSGHVPGTQQVQTKDLSYGATKPLTHYPNPMATQVGQPPSSLQQLQNQVRAQFSNAPTQQQLQMSQSQQMQISQGHHRMQMSQSQQMQMQQPPHQFSMSQQQSFTMSSNMAQNQNQFVNDPIKMQMYQEKMRQEQQQQQQQQQQQMMEQQRRAQMQQYMNRPPPEYKMQGNPTSGFPVNGMGPSPLQTMQNMVNQTNTIPGGYSQVKSEVGTMTPQGQTIQTSSVSGVQSIATQGVPGSQGMHPDMVPSNAGPMDSYTAQQMQRQLYKQTQMSAVSANAQTVGVARAQRPAAPTYSSTIMRNQRPPNVNVGPEGLNISQPRNPAEWPRPMMGSTAQRHPGPQQGQMGRHPAPGSMIPYGNYSNNVPGMQMQQQRTGQISAMQGQSVVMQNNAQAVMQQRVQMSQQMVLRQNMVSTSQSGTPPYTVNSSGALTNPTNHQTPSGNPHPQNSYTSAGPTGQSDFPLDFLDTTQSGNSDFFESMVQNTNSSDFAILEEILGK